MEEPIEQGTVGTDVYVYQMPPIEPLPSGPNHKWLYIGIAAVIIIILGILIAL